jgi:hypothetical protein
MVGYIQLRHRVPYTMIFFGFGLCIAYKSRVAEKRYLEGYVDVIMELQVVHCRL